MALILKDRVWESSTSTGTGNFVLGGTKTGYRTFSSVLANGDTCFYTIVADDGLWETGLATYNSGTNSLTRTTRYDNSSGTTAAINFAAGAKEVFLSLPASRFNEKLSSTANLQDLTNASSARSNLGLGTAAVANIVDGTSGGGNGVLQAYPSILELGRSGSGDRSTFIDLIASGDPGTVDRSARIIRSSGVNGNLLIQNIGTGELSLQNPNGLITATSAASKTDTTSGRIIAVGDFGLGVPSDIVADSEDTITSGFYRSMSIATNVPVTANGGQCIVTSWGDSSHVNQLWFDHNSNPNNLDYHKIIWKIKRGGTWATNPVEILHSENGVYKSEVATDINDLSLTKIALVNTAGRIEPISLTSSDDLNNFSTVGDYYWDNTSTPINAPVASTAGRLEVRYTRSGSYRDQQFFPYNSIASYRRTANGTGIWTSWVRLATENASTTGNAATATALQTARTINGTSFNGTANITTSSWGTSRTLSFTGDVTGTNSVNGSNNVATALTIANSAVTHAKYQNIATQRILGRGTAGSGNVEELTIGTGLDLSTGGVLSNNKETITGNAGSATVLQTTRSINGTNFNGSANITTSSWGTARNLQVDLAKNSVTSVNGSANVTNIGVQGALPVANGGTGSTTASNARTALGLGAAAVAGVYTGGATPSSSDVMAASPANIEINYHGSGDRLAYIDFHSRDGTNFDGRIARYEGANGTFDLVNSNGSVTNTLSLAANSQTCNFNMEAGAGLSFVKVAADGVAYYRADHTSGAATGNWFFACYKGGAVIGSISTASGSSVSFNTTSDYRLKEQVQPMVGALDRIMATNPVTYKWKSDGSAGEGFIAHELAEVVPLAVTGEKDAVDEDGKPKHQQVDYSKLTPVLLAGIQELVAEINTLKQRIEVLESND